MKQIRHIGMAVCLLAGCLLSCRKEFTCPQQSRVEFMFDWQQLPSAAKTGDGMALRFYASDGQVYDMESDTVCFRGSLPVGIYQIYKVGICTEKKIQASDNKYALYQWFMIVLGFAISFIDFGGLVLDWCIFVSRLFLGFGFYL